MGMLHMQWFLEYAESLNCLKMKLCFKWILIFYSNLFDDKPAGIKITTEHLVTDIRTWVLCVHPSFSHGRNENGENTAPVRFVTVSVMWENTTSAFLLLETVPEVCPAEAAVCL